MLVVNPTAVLPIPVGRCKYQLKICRHVYVSRSCYEQSGKRQAIDLPVVVELGQGIGFGYVEFIIFKLAINPAPQAAKPISLVFYRQDRFFAGISVLSLLEETAGLDPSAPGPERENPYNLHIGGLFHLTGDIELSSLARIKANQGRTSNQ